MVSDCMTKMSASAIPEGLLLHASRCSMSVSALARNARVTAICVAMSNAPNLLRRMADRIGCISMVPLLRLELPRGLHVCGPPGGIQPREYRRRHRQQHGHPGIHPVEMCQRDEFLGQQRAGGPQPQCRQDEPA